MSINRFYRSMSTLRFRISKAVEGTSKPPIPQAYAWASNYKETPTRPLLDVSQGVPGVPPPKLFLDELARTSSSPTSCGYVPNVGEPALRQAIVQEMKIAYGKNADISPDDIAITAGCNLAFSAAIMTIAERGDQVILPVPWYFNNEMTLSMLGIETVCLPTSPDAGFLPSAEECSKLITPKTKAIVLVSPNNPTGAIYPASLLAEFAALAHKYQIALIIDETYHDFIPDDSLPPHNLFFSTTAPSTNSNLISIQSHDSPTRISPQGLPEDWSWRNTLIHIFSFSKSYCIPGHRVGLVCASPDLIPSLNIALDNLQICAPRPPQLALSAVLPLLRPFVRKNKEDLLHRHKIFKEHLPAGWDIGAQGGYFAFVKHPWKGVKSEVVCKRLAEEIGVVCLPASFFGPASSGTGLERWVRFSVANVDDEKLKLVCLRLKEAMDVFGWELEN
ncbi:Pyridoxal phosphate-dependent transferase [Abortiporus biennis]